MPLGLLLMDSSCSLFAAKAGASKVVAVDGSAKMSSVATQVCILLIIIPNYWPLFAMSPFTVTFNVQVAKINGLLYDENTKVEQNRSPHVISVVHTKAEELNHKIQIPPNGFDVLVSEWMGYCLLYESMLSSVIYARDHFLKPGGAILPDTATIVSS
jgi:protein arginine N-methyltransferase 3